MSLTLQQGAEKAVAEEISRQAETWHKLIIRNLRIAGEEAVSKARSVATEGGQAAAGLTPYTVQTGNLTSSVGYAVTCDGQIVAMSDFPTVEQGNEGSEKGRSYVQELAAQFPQGYALILVAGMHYASYVQELHNRDVLVSGSLLAEQLIKELQQTIKQ